MPTQANLDSSQPVPRLSDVEIESLSWGEIARAGRTIARLRIVLFPIMLLVASVLIWLEPAPWRIWLVAIVGAAGATVTVRDFLWLRDRSIEPRHVPYLLSLVIAMQATLIAISGGVESPFFVILTPMAVLPAIVLGRVKSFVSFLLIPLTVIWFFTIGAVVGWLPSLRPAYWGAGVDFGSNAVYSYTQAVIFTFAISLGGSVGLFLRRAVRNGARAAVEARLELVEAVRQQNRDLMTLSGELAHELKNPLASIQGLSGLIAKKLAPGSKEAEQMQVLISEVRRMGTNLDEFLNFSRPISRLATQEVHPAALLADVILMHEGLAHQRGIVLKVDPGDASPLVCDPRKVKQVVMNLLQNALEATPAGGQILATTRHGEGVACFVIQDTGPGLSQEVRDRLFTPGATTKPDGAGLGLVIARAIAEQHGGSLTLANAAPRGCRAELTLPLKPRTRNGDGA